MRKLVVQPSEQAQGLTTLSDNVFPLAKPAEIYLHSL